MILSLGEISAEQIDRMSYNELVGLVRETNRPPGGNSSIQFVANRLHIGPQHAVLEIGTSTGTTAFELTRITGCTVIGIDLLAHSIAEAQRRADILGMVRVQFRIANAEALPFADRTFDMVFCGNVTSLITDGNKAFSEYRRVLKENGYIVAIPMYYLEAPSDELVSRVRAAIQVEIPVRYRHEATSFFYHQDLECYCTADFHFDQISDADVKDFCTAMLSQEHLKSLSVSAFKALERIYTEYMLLFRDNVAYMGYSVIILRKSAFQEDPELFRGKHIPSRGGWHTEVLAD